MNITKKIEKYLMEGFVSEGTIPKSVKKFIEYCMDYGVSKKEVDSLIRKSKGDLASVIDELMDMVRDDVSPGDFDEIDGLRMDAYSDV